MSPVISRSQALNILQKCQYGETSVPTFGGNIPNLGSLVKNFLAKSSQIDYSASAQHHQLHSSLAATMPSNSKIIEANPSFNFVEQ